MEHFGLRVSPGKYGLKLSRENYAVINNRSSFETGKFYTDEWCEDHRNKCLENFDLNMKFYSSINRNEFNQALNKFLDQNKEFVVVFDLKQYENVKGYYLMVLDEYCQVYIGTTKNIKARIQKHWQSQRYFDRLLFSMEAVSTSVLSIDSFRALDTTRIYVYPIDELYDLENKFLLQIPPDFSCNRVAGGKMEGPLGLLHGILTTKERKLT